MNISFLYMNKEIHVELITVYGVTRMSVDGITEIVEPTKNGFLTKPRSAISKLFKRKGVILIPCDRAQELLYELDVIRQNEILQSIENWEDHYSAPQGAIIYGVLRPGLELGWYVVHTMLSADGTNYTDYVKPCFIFVGSNLICDRIKADRGIDNYYVYQGIVFPMTTIDRKDFSDIISCSTVQMVYTSDFKGRKI